MTNYEALMQAVKEDPENLDLCKRVWEAIGTGQDSRDLVLIFRTPAMSTLEGMQGFAQAARWLCDESSEIPRADVFDEDFMAALSRARAGLPHDGDLLWLEQLATDLLTGKIHP